MRTLNRMDQLVVEEAKVACANLVGLAKPFGTLAGTDARARVHRFAQGLLEALASLDEELER